MFAQLRGWISSLFTPSQPALDGMRLGPDDNVDNPLMLQFFTWDTLHPTLSWWGHLENEIPSLAIMGFTQLWLPPPNKGENKVREVIIFVEFSTPVKKGRGYDAYDLWDLGTVETRWGGREAYLRACHAARSHGVDVLVDAVLNHKLGADACERFPAIPVNPQNRLEDAGPERIISVTNDVGVDRFRLQRQRWEGLQRLEMEAGALQWHVSIGITRRGQVVSTGSPALAIRAGQSMYVHTELGNYDYLLGVDIDHRHPQVQKDMLDWGVWILQTTGASGFRLDAIKHMDYRFILKFLKHTRNNLQRSNIFAVSEFWSGDLKSIIPYIKICRGATSFFDVPLHMNFHEASKQGSKYDLRRILDNTIVKAFPRDAVTFVDNHDTVKGQSLESWVSTDFKLQAYAIILLRRAGHPCVFYGDLYANEECGDARIEKLLPALIEARKRFAYGRCDDYLLEQSCIGFVRAGDSKHAGCAVVLSNREPGPSHSLRMSVGSENANTTYRPLMHESDATVSVDSEGWGSFSCPANGVQIWVRE
ncbi:Glycoside hydrolase family 13 protein [Mycena indigotica]|uniref:Glycoside hydrolase family 13 protein n=1 Tax=Mycena indigotica TaxID=2126181 RepID=A0A8H6T7C4_9AGAR|nr:Glycoside hydrolase family 13 protein [Mycena indigotica]KAF7312255.1 Glycoside hydrolase family 13 protein [Mycena indigotica]